MVPTSLDAWSNGWGLKKLPRTVETFCGMGKLSKYPPLFSHQKSNVHVTQKVSAVLFAVRDGWWIICHNKHLPVTGFHKWNVIGGVPKVRFSKRQLSSGCI